MNFGGQQQKEDSLLTAEREAAKTDKIDAIRERVSRLTDQLVRLYGARSSLFGGSPPISGF